MREKGRRQPVSGSSNLGSRVFLLILLLSVGCSPGTTPEATDKIKVTVSILPQQYFVERIGGQYVDVNVMVLPGSSPATYEPKPAQLKALSQADAYVSIGVPFEDAWLGRIASANPDMLMVDTTQGIERAGDDPHIWLSPKLVRVQAQTIYDALAQIDPSHTATYQTNLNGFLVEIDALDAEIRTTLASVKSRYYMVFHPSWGYFSRDYELEMIPIEIGGQEPSAAELTDLIREAREEGIKIIFAQPEFSTRDAETIAHEIGGEVLLISPLALDWPDNLRKAADVFAEALGQ